MGSAWKILHENNYFWSMMKKSSVSRMQRFMYSQILCYVLERWIRNQHQVLLGKNSWVGSRVHHNTELRTQLTENRWNSSGIFSQDSLHCSSSKKSKSSWTKWANQNNSKDELSSCRCSMTSYEELKTMSKNVLLTPHLCLYVQKRCPAGRWSFLGPGSETKWYSTYNERPQGEWNRVAELMMIKFRESGNPVSEPRVHCLEERSKAKEVGNYQYTSVPMVKRLKLFFAQLFLLISSVPTELSQISVMNTGPIKQERRDLCWQDNSTHCSSQQTCW